MAAPHPNLEFFLRIIESKDEIANRFVQMARIGPNGGGGAFSIVFKAFDKESKKFVALKFFDPSVNDSYRLESFKREADILGTLSGQADVLQRISQLAEFKEKLQHETGFSIDIPFTYYCTELAQRDLGTL